VAGQLDTFERTFLAGGTIPQYARVKLSGASVVVAGLAEVGIGVAQRAAVSGDYIAVRFYKAPTHKVIAKEAIAAGALIYSEAGGLVQDTAEATAFQLGYALEAAAAENDIIEAYLMPAVSTTAAS
jgi:Zn-dependent alcohol dehydrogenase